MKSLNDPDKKRPWFRIGPGFILALVIAAAIIAWGQLPNKTPYAPGAGSLVWEADAQGHLRRVSAPTAVKQAPLPPLWKPEVSLLLERASELHLSGAQRSRLTTLNTAWQREKTEMEAVLNRSSVEAHTVLEHATPERPASATQIMNNLSDYSTLSAEYDARRAAFWVQGCAVLTAEQKKAFEKLGEAARI